MKDFIALAIVFSVVFVFSVYHPLADFAANPPYWGDEAVGVEKARNIIEHRAADVLVAPNVMSGQPYATAAAGPLLTFPLALFFHFFGVSVFNVRLFMVLWMLLLAATFYLVIKSFFGRKGAVIAALLMVTFSPFYANGKTSTGDIPGLFVLLCGLYLLYIREQYFFAGVCAALALTTKPSLYIPIIAIVALEMLYTERMWRFRNLLVFFAGALIVILPWIYFLVPNVLSKNAWIVTYHFFANPFPDGSKNVLTLYTDEPELVLNTTTYHYVLLLLMAAIAVFVIRHRIDPGARLIRFAFLYGLIALVLYIRSPGWLRYLLGGELLFFAVWLSVVESVFSWHRMRRSIALGVACALIIAQGVHFVKYSWRPASWAVTQSASALNAILRQDDSIGFINDLPTASLVRSRNRFLIVRISGNTVLGENPLSRTPEGLPTYIFVSKKGLEGEFVAPYAETLKKYYMRIDGLHPTAALFKKL